MPTLFEIAIYRVTPEKWHADIDARVALHREAYFRQVPEGYVPPPDVILHHEGLWAATSGASVPYPYNEVVGWVRLDADDPGHIKGDAWRTRQNRVRRNFCPQYEAIGRVLETLVLGDETCDEIVRDLREQLVGLTRGREVFQALYIDLEAFDTVAPLLDWPTLCAPP